MQEDERSSSFDEDALRDQLETLRGKFGVTVVNILDQQHVLSALRVPPGMWHDGAAARGLLEIAITELGQAGDPLLVAYGYKTRDARPGWEKSIQQRRGSKRDPKMHVQDERRAIDQLVAHLRRRSDGQPVGHDSAHDSARVDHLAVETIELPFNPRGRYDELWFQVIHLSPKKAEVAAASDVYIDRVEFSKSGEWVTARIERLHPSPEITRQTWRAIGRRDFSSGIFLTFWGDGLRNAASRGVIALRTSENREVAYEGSYTRIPDDDGKPRPPRWLTRQLSWHTHVPDEYLPRVALLDLDNTLRRGWCIRDFALSAHVDDLVYGGQFRDEVERLFKEYLRERVMTHDDLARTTAAQFRRLEDANPAGRLAEAAASFAREEGELELHAFARPVVAALRDNDIAPILLTGAPAVIARELAKGLGIGRIIALDTANEETIGNPGTSDGKRSAVELVRGEGRFIFLGAGDSVSDLPVLRSARHRLAAETLRDHLPHSRGGTIYFTGDSTSQDVLPGLIPLLRPARLT